MEDQEIKSMVDGMLAAIIFTMPDEEDASVIPVSEIDKFTPAARELATRAVRKFHDLIRAEGYTDALVQEYRYGDGGNPWWSMGVDLWMTGSGSGISFSDNLSNTDFPAREFDARIRKMFGQFEHAEVWYNKETDMIEFSIYQPTF